MSHPSPSETPFGGEETEHGALIVHLRLRVAGMTGRCMSLEVRRLCREAVRHLDLRNHMILRMEAE